MNPTATRLLAGLVTISASMMLPLVVAAPAHADRCQPEELAGLEGIIDEDKNPVCKVLDTQVYPRLGCTPPSTTLQRCATQENTVSQYICVAGIGQRPEPLCTLLGFS